MQLSRKDDKLHYFAVKKLLALLRGINSKHHGNTSKHHDSYCLNSFYSFATENKIQLHKRVCEDKKFCSIITPSDDNKILEFNQYQKSDKAPFIIYADPACITERLMDANIILKTKVSEHIPSGFSRSTKSLFRRIENKHDLYRDKDCMNKHTTKIIDVKKVKNDVINKRAARII